MARVKGVKMEATDPMMNLQLICLKTAPLMDSKEAPSMDRKAKAMAHKGWITTIRRRRGVLGVSRVDRVIRVIIQVITPNGVGTVGGGCGAETASGVTDATITRVIITANFYQFSAPRLNGLIGNFSQFPI